MDSFLFTLLSFLVALAILITVHEFGHFWVARKLGVKVLRFSIGFGKALWKRTGRVDGTEYVIAAIPLGGYVKMLDEREGEVPEHELARAFNRQPLKVRSAIVVAGPAFNFLFAIAAFWMIFVTGDTGMRPLVGEVTEGSAAYSAGFQPGDELLTVGERKTPTWEAAVYALLTESGSGDALPVMVRDQTGLEVLRALPGAQLMHLPEDGRILEGIGITPKRPRVLPVIGQVVLGEAADEAGLKPGDIIRSIDGKPVSSWSELVSLIREKPAQKITLELEREGSWRKLPLHIGVREEGGKRYGRIGAGVEIPDGLYDQYRTEIRLGPVEALGAAVVKSWDMSVFMLRMLGRMLTGQASVKNLSGPISIAQSAGQSASYGPIYFIKFLALVSISLGVLNLLPIPVLDGGHLFFYLIEAVKGSPLSDEVMMQGQRIGILLLLALMGLAFYVDLSRLLG
jgi:regulator of sigma E protease